MKKFLSLVLALSMVLALVACGGDNDTTSDGNDSTTNDTQSGDTTTNTNTNEGSTIAEKTPISDLVTWQLSSSEMEVFLIQNSESASDLDVLCNLYSALLEVNNKGQLVPAIATEWGTEDGGLTWTFKLRNDVTWVDMNGNKKADCTAQDWLTALEWILNFHKNGAKNTSMTCGLIAGAQDYYDYTKDLDEATAMALTVDGKFAEMVGIEAPDDYTLVYHCTKNAPYFDTLAVSAALYPLPQGLIDEVGVENVLSITNTNMWYNGPYTMTSYIQGNEKVYTKNEAYWDTSCTLFDTVTCMMIADGTTDDQLYMTGEVDLTVLNESTVKRIAEDPSNEYYDYLVETRPKKYSYQFHWNFAKNNEDGTPDTNFNNAIANEAFRLSLTYGLELDKYWAITNALNPESCKNLAYTMQGLLYFSDGTDYVDKVIAALNYGDSRVDSAKAQAYKEQAMSELAGIVTFPVEFDYYIKSGNQTSLDSATIVKEIFESMGTDYITMKICEYVSSATQEVYRPSLQSVTINGWGADYGDPENFIIQEIYGSDEAYYANNYSNINNVERNDNTAALLDTYQEFTDLANAASVIYDDLDARYQAYVDAEVYMIEHGLVLPCSYSVQWRLTKVNEYSQMNAMFGCQNNMYKNMETAAEGYTTEEYEQIKAAYYAS